jgi:hypothetical protein
MYFRPIDLAYCQGMLICKIGIVIFEIKEKKLCLILNLVEFKLVSGFTFPAKILHTTLIKITAQLVQK